MLAAQGLRELGTIPYLLGGALLLKTTFSVRGLGRAAQVTRRFLEARDLDAARSSLGRLVSRDTQTLTEPLVAAAAIESVGENTTDSYIAPWLAFALLGLPGAFAYRAVNTLDSMIGYHGKYEYSGKAAAILDDLVNLVPARISAMLLLAAGMFAGLIRRVISGNRGTGHIEDLSVPARLEHHVSRSWADGEPQRRLDDGCIVRTGWCGLEKPGHYLIGSNLRRACCCGYRSGGEPGLPDCSAGGASGAVPVGHGADNDMTRTVHGGLNYTELKSLGLTPGDIVDFSASINPLGTARECLTP